MFRYYIRKLFLGAGFLLLVFFLVNRRPEHLAHSFLGTSWRTDTVPETEIELNGSNLTSERPEEKPDRRFYVFSPQCKIPYVNPFAKTFFQWEPIKFKPCTNEPSLVSVIYDLSKRQYILHLNTEVALKYFANYSTYGCTYQEIGPGSNDRYAYIKSPVYLHQDWVVPSAFLGVIVECHEMKNTSRVLQRDAFSFVQHPRNRNESNDAKRGAKYPNIFLFGVDSLSRMNFHRSMPLTAKFVSREGWYEMEGYNKVGDNTLPNLLAVLTGRTPRQWRSKCDVRSPGCLDSLTFLWDHFHNAGYLTAYAEDQTAISTFNYLKMGFSRQPVDYYLRPFLMVIEQAMKSMEYLGSKYCVGRKTSLNYIFDFAKQLIERFLVEQRKPLFGLFWTSSFTHEDFRGVRDLDQPLVRYLEEFHELGLFERSIVILFSDHGSRYGPLAEHYTGFLEERLPMLHIYLPPWYRKRYPSAAKALRLNRNRLSSNHDLYLGIRHVLEQLHPRMEFSQSPISKGTQSILTELPKNRTCSQAGIPAHWCTCKPFVDVPLTSFIVVLTKLAVFRMNRFLKMLNVEGDCHTVGLTQVLKADRQLHFDELGNVVAASDGLDTFSLVFTTYPNGGVFRSIAQSNDDHSIVHIEIDMISRLNSYGNQSYCVKDAVAKKFCLCRKDKLLNLQEGGVTRVRKVKYAFVEDHEDDYYDENKIVNGSLKFVH